MHNVHRYKYQILVHRTVRFMVYQVLHTFTYWGLQMISTSVFKKAKDKKGLPRKLRFITTTKSTQLEWPKWKPKTNFQSFMRRGHIPETRKEGGLTSIKMERSPQEGGNVQCSHYMKLVASPLAYVDIQNLSIVVLQKRVQTWYNTSRVTCDAPLWRRHCDSRPKGAIATRWAQCWSNVPLVPWY